MSLLIAKVVFISSFTVATFGCTLAYSSVRILLWRSKEVSSSPAGIGGSSLKGVASGPLPLMEILMYCEAFLFYVALYDLSPTIAPCITNLDSICVLMIRLAYGFPVGDFINGYLAILVRAMLM